MGKKIIKASLLALFILFFTAQGVSAQGLVPCGRRSDDPSTTDIDESCPCTFCHFLILFRRILDFGLKIVFIIAAAILVIGGLIFILQSSSPSVAGKVKGILKSVVIGLLIISFSWLTVNLIFTFIGVAEWTGLRENWFKITCDFGC